MSKTPTERLAVLEEQMRNMKDQLHGVSDNVDKILARLVKYDGRWGMFLLVGSALVGAVVYFKEVVIHWLKLKLGQ